MATIKWTFSHSCHKASQIAVVGQLTIFFIVNKFELIYGKAFVCGGQIVCGCEQGVSGERMGDACGTYGEKGNVYRVLCGKYEKKT